MIKKFLVNFVTIMVTMAIVGSVYVVIVNGEPADVLPILIGAAVVGAPISAYFAWKNRSR